MEGRFERNAEAGGEKGQDKSDKRTWLERLTDRFEERKEKSQPGDDHTEKKMSFSGFVAGIFNRSGVHQEPKTKGGNTWIDKAIDDNEASQDAADHEKIESMDEPTRTEFLMVVAERFKDAGGRFVRFMSRQREVVDHPEVREVQQMYEDDYEDDLSNVPELEIPKAAAPPFDFAIDARAAEIPTENKSPSMAESVIKTDLGETPGLSVGIGSIDDFDYSGGDAGLGPRGEVRTDGDVTTVMYKPRVRDILFASSVGSAYERREFKRTEKRVERRLEKKLGRKIDKARVQDHAKVEKEVKKVAESRARFEAERMRYKAELKQATDAAVPETKAPDVSRNEPKSSSNDPDRVASVSKHFIENIFEDASLAAAQQVANEAKPVEGLEFEKLKPRVKDIESTPDNVYASVVAADVSAHAVKAVTNPESAGVGKSPEIKNPFKERLERSYKEQSMDSPEVNTGSSNKAREARSLYDGAPSLNEILSDRTNIPKPNKTLKQKIATGSSGVSSDRVPYNWAAVAVILALILIGLLFISAL